MRFATILLLVAGTASGFVPAAANSQDRGSADTPVVQAAVIPVPPVPNALYVEVRSAKLRQNPQHWARGVADLNYGDVVSEIGRAGDWIQVKNGAGATGYVHASAVTKKEVILKAQYAQATSGTASLADIVLAGKGFNDEVEASYAASGVNVDYTVLNRMESAQVDDGELEEFLRAGGLAVGVGKPKA